MYLPAVGSCTFKNVKHKGELSISPLPRLCSWGGSEFCGGVADLKVNSCISTASLPWLVVVSSILRFISPCAQLCPSTRVLRVPQGLHQLPEPAAAPPGRALPQGPALYPLPLAGIHCGLCGWLWGVWSYVEVVVFLLERNCAA